MPSIISKYPLDTTGRSPTNLVSGEKQLLLPRGNTPYRVVSFSQGGFYTPSLKVYDKNFRLLIKNVDYIATYKHVDASAYVGIEICSAIVILNAVLTDHVLIGGQLVGSDYAFSLTVEDDTIGYLEGLGAGVVPTWAGFNGDEPQWQPGELQEDRWERYHYGNLNAAVERLAGVITSGNGQAEDLERANIRARYQAFLDRFQGQINAHITNQANPHALNKGHVGLDQIQNYPVADSATARAGVSAAHYMTQRGVYDMIDQFGSIPLQNHLNARYTTHSPTAAQLNTYTKTVFDSKIDLKLPIDGTAVNANGIMGWTPANPGVPSNMTQTPAYNECRRGLNGASFVTGKVNPARLGNGVADSTTFLLAYGTWQKFSDYYIFYTAGGGAEIFWGGYQGNNATALANIRVTFADENAFPWGTVVIFQVSNVETYTYGNGGNDPHSFVSFRAAFRSPTDWFILG